MYDLRLTPFECTTGAACLMNVYIHDDLDPSTRARRESWVLATTLYADDYCYIEEASSNFETSDGGREIKSASFDEYLLKTKFHADRARVIIGLAGFAITYSPETGKPIMFHPARLSESLAQYNTESLSQYDARSGGLYRRAN